MPAIPRTVPVCGACRSDLRVEARRDNSEAHNLIRIAGVQLYACRRCAQSERRLTGQLCPSCQTASVIERLDTREPWCVRCDHAVVVCDNCGRFVAGPECRSCGSCRPRVEFEGEPSALFPRYLGVEIECGGNETRPTRDWFSRLGGEGEIDDDGSVSFQAWTMEFKPFPARGDAFAQRMTRVGALFREVGVEVNRSCGLHVHVDARDFTSSDLLKLVRLNQKIEAAMYGIVSRSRRSNHFSLPWRDALMAPHPIPTIPLTIRETIAPDAAVPCDPAGDDDPAKRALAVEANIHGGVREARRFKRQPHKCGERYHGLNLTAIPLLGTVEFRHHQGTANPHKIMMWAALCTAVIEYAKNHTEEEIVRLRGTPAEVLDKVLRGPVLAPVRAWVRKRRAFFAAEEHGRRVPQGRAAPVEPPEPLDISTERESAESGEVGAGGRIGRRGHGGAPRPVAFDPEED